MISYNGTESRDVLQLLESCSDRLRNGFSAVAFSGGVDSSILAKILENRCRLYTVGTPDSKDMQQALAVADKHGWDLLPIILDEETVYKALPLVSPLLSAPSPMTLNFNIPLFVTSQTACERLVVAGNGADELFGGYNRYQRMDDHTFIGESKMDVERLLRIDLQDSRVIVASTGHVLETPYTSPELVEKVLCMPRIMRSDKKVLRDIARELGLENHSREKKAAQFGSGAAKVLRRIARAEGCGEEELVMRYRK